MQKQFKQLKRVIRQLWALPDSLDRIDGKLNTLLKNEWENYATLAHDMEIQTCVRASQASAQYVLENMSFAQAFKGGENTCFGIDFVGTRKLLEFALSQVKLDGLYLEFGVHKGWSVNVIASTVNQEVHGFDSFYGLPEDWKVDSRAGKFSLNGQLPEVKENVVLYPGWFSDVLPGFLSDHPGNVAFLHIDCDLYSSTKYVLETLADRIQPGTIIVFDEYYNYPGWEMYEFKAFQEFIHERHMAYEYIGYNARGYSVGVKINQVSQNG